MIEPGAEVEWNWGAGHPRGVVVERFTEPVTVTIRGKDITRNASEDKPAYLIEQDDGDQVLKSESELTVVGS